MKQTKIRITNEYGVVFATLISESYKPGITMPSSDFFQVSLTGDENIVVYNFRHKHDKKSSDEEMINNTIKLIIDFSNNITSEISEEFKKELRTAVEELLKHN